MKKTQDTQQPEQQPAPGTTATATAAEVPALPTPENTPRPEGGSYHWNGTGWIENQPYAPPAP